MRAFYYCKLLHELFFGLRSVVLFLNANVYTLDRRLIQTEIVHMTMQKDVTLLQWAFWDLVKWIVIDQHTILVPIINYVDEAQVLAPCLRTVVIPFDKHLVSSQTTEDVPQRWLCC